MVRIGIKDEQQIKHSLKRLINIGNIKEEQIIVNDKVLYINVSATKKIKEKTYRGEVTKVIRIAVCFSLTKEAKPCLFIVDNTEIGNRKSVTILRVFNTKDLKAYMKRKFNFETTKYDLNSLSKRVDK